MLSKALNENVFTMLKWHAKPSDIPIFCSCLTNICPFLQKKSLEFFYFTSLKILKNGLFLRRRYKFIFDKFQEFNLKTPLFDDLEELFQRS